MQKVMELISFNKLNVWGNIPVLHLLCDILYTISFSNADTLEFSQTAMNYNNYL